MTAHECPQCSNSHCQKDDDREGAYVNVRSLYGYSWSKLWYCSDCLTEAIMHRFEKPPPGGPHAPTVSIETARWVTKAHRRFQQLVDEGASAEDAMKEVLGQR